MNNKDIFWYGTFAKFKRGFGKFLTLFFGFIALISLPFSMITTVIFVIPAILGIVLWSKGAEETFDYQQRSGSRIHKGDGW